MEENLYEDSFECAIQSETENPQDNLQENYQETPQKQANEKSISVFVKVNENGFVTDVCSDVFIKDFDGWVKIDEGFGDRFAHAQSLYFDEPLINEKGEYTQKLKKED